MGRDSALLALARGQAAARLGGSSVVRARGQAGTRLGSRVGDRQTPGDSQGGRVGDTEPGTGTSGCQPDLLALAADRQTPGWGQELGTGSRQGEAQPQIRGQAAAWLIGRVGDRQIRTRFGT